MSSTFVTTRQSCSLAAVIVAAILAIAILAPSAADAIPTGEPTAAASQLDEQRSGLKSVVSAIEHTRSELKQKL